MFGGVDKLMHFLTGGFVTSLSCMVLCSLFNVITGFYPVLIVIISVVLSAVAGIIKEMIDSHGLKNRELFDKDDIKMTLDGGVIAGIIILISLIF